MSPIANLFWNARERRLRAGWRLLVFLVMLLVVAAVEGRVRAGLAGRLPDLYEALVRALVPAPYPEPHCGHPTAQISSTNGTTPLKLVEPVKVRWG